ncbi:MAG: secondary thiamine-phosphate synthase enzyme YjbQ [Candidatus Aenigmatarchaeota archaeon]
MILTERVTVQTKPDLDIVDITDRVAEIVQKSQLKSGFVNIFVPGSTASISTIEFEPNLVKDVKAAMERIAPSDIPYEHHKTWGDDNGKSHVRATLMGPGITVPFENKRLLLGQWQQLTVLDFDTKPREREIIVQLVGE